MSEREISEAEKTKPTLRTFAARDIESGAALMSALFGDSATVDFHGSRDDFSLNFCALALDDLTLAQADLTNGLISREIGESVHVTLPLAGRLTCRAAQRDSQASAGRTAPVGLPFERVTARAASGSGLALTLPFRTLIARAECLTGGTFDPASISATPGTLDLATPNGATLARNMSAAFDELTRLSSVGLGALALSGYRDVLLNLATVALLPSVGASIGRGATRRAPALVRRARDFIADRSTEAVDLTRLAAELGVSMRTLQDNFQRSYGLSPRDFLMECRLEMARRRLRSPEPGASVTRIAVESGFTDLGHFSTKYRRRYGESPSDTLRATRG